MENMKLLYADINAISENEEKLANLVSEYQKNGMDGVYIYDFSTDGEVREEFFSKLRKIHEKCGIRFKTGIYAGRFEDIKKAYYTGAETVYMRLTSDMEAVKAGLARFGADRVGFELDYSKDECTEEKFKKIKDMEITNIMIKHVDDSDAFFERLKDSGFTVFLRDSLKRHDLTSLLKYEVTGGVATTLYQGKDVRKIKDELKDSGITVYEAKSAIPFSEFKLNSDGLIPCITTDFDTGEVLMLAYMNEESYNRTVATGKMNYYSRSRHELWEKGDTSGHFQYVVSLSIDCDKDTILAKVHQVGAACHTGHHSCFYTDLAKFEDNRRETGSLSVFDDVYNTIMDRKEHPKEGSYTNYLFDKGIDKILKKCGEESTEIVIAAKNPDRAELRYEIADYMYHLMVLMADSGLKWEDICEELASRE